MISGPTDPKSSQAQPSWVVGPPVAAASRLGLLIDGEFLVKGILGQGELGVTYEADNTRLKRRFAVLMLSRELKPTHAMMLAVRDDLRRAQQLTAAGLMPVKLIADRDGIPGFATELLEGETLRSRLSRGPLRVERALGAVLSVARTLEAAHKVGLIHGDLRPENIFLVRPGSKSTFAGKVMVVEHALHHLRRRTPGLDDRLPMYKLMYRPPEQVMGEAGASELGDVWVLGAILFECLTAKPAFYAEEPEFVLDNLANPPPPLKPNPALGLGPELADSLNLLIGSTSCRDLESRVPNMAELIEGLEQIVRGAGLKLPDVVVESKEEAAAAPQPTAAPNRRMNRLLQRLSGVFPQIQLPPPGPGDTPSPSPPSGVMPVQVNLEAQASMPKLQPIVPPKERVSRILKKLSGAFPVISGPLPDEPTPPAPISVGQTGSSPSAITPKMSADDIAAHAAAGAAAATQPGVAAPTVPAVPVPVPVHAAPTMPPVEAAAPIVERQPPPASGQVANSADQPTPKISDLDRALDILKRQRAQATPQAPEPTARPLAAAPVGERPTMPPTDLAPTAQLLDMVAPPVVALTHETTQPPAAAVLSPPPAAPATVAPATVAPATVAPAAVAPSGDASPPVALAAEAIPAVAKEPEVAPPPPAISALAEPPPPSAPPSQKTPPPAQSQKTPSPLLQAKPSAHSPVRPPEPKPAAALEPLPSTSTPASAAVASTKTPPIPAVVSAKTPPLPAIVSQKTPPPPVSQKTPSPLAAPVPSTKTPAPLAAPVPSTKTPAPLAAPAPSAKTPPIPTVLKAPEVRPVAVEPAPSTKTPPLAIVASAAESERPPVEALPAAVESAPIVAPSENKPAIDPEVPTVKPRDVSLSSAETPKSGQYRSTSLPSGPNIGLDSTLAPEDLAEYIETSSGSLPVPPPNATLAAPAAAVAPPIPVAPPVPAAPAATPTVPPLMPLFTPTSPGEADALAGGELQPLANPPSLSEIATKPALAALAQKLAAVKPVILTPPPLAEQATQPALRRMPITELATQARLDALPALLAAESGAGNAATSGAMAALGSDAPTPASTPAPSGELIPPTAPAANPPPIPPAEKPRPPRPPRVSQLIAALQAKQGQEPPQTGDSTAPRAAAAAPVPASGHVSPGRVSPGIIAPAPDILAARLTSPEPSATSTPQAASISQNVQPGALGFVLRHQELLAALLGAFLVMVGTLLYLLFRS